MRKAEKRNCEGGIVKAEKGIALVLFQHSAFSIPHSPFRIHNSQFP